MKILYLRVDGVLTMSQLRQYALVNLLPGSLWTAIEHEV